MEWLNMRPATMYNPGVNRMQAEFIPANFGPHKYELQIEESIGAVPPYNSKTSKMNDPGPPKQMRVKSGYTGHVAHGRDFIGGRYCNSNSVLPAHQQLVSDQCRDGLRSRHPDVLGNAIQRQPTGSNDG
jgi:hypothetical protein